VLLGVLCIVLALPALAKPTPTPTPAPIGGLSFRDQVEVTVVNIDAYVRDGDGSPVLGLTAEDFRILQDGEERPVSHFGVYTKEIFRSRVAPSSSALPVPTPTPVASEDRSQGEEAEALEIKPVYVVLYVDNENIRPFDRNRVLRRVRGFVEDNLFPPVQMMVVSYQRSFKILQPFTDDKRAVLDALRSLRTFTGGRTERDSTRRQIMEEMRRERENHRAQGYDRASGSERSYRQIRAYAEEEASQLSFSLTAIRQVITLMAGLPGRKSMVYISSGLPMVPGLELFYGYADIFKDTSIMTLTARFERSRQFEALTSAANAQAVRIYAIDATGLKVSAGVSAQSQYAVDPLTSSVGSNNYQDSLRFMARNTGGLAVINTNDISGGLDRIEDDLFTYYSLGYTIGASGVDKVHRIEVEVPGTDYRVRHRRRFVEKSLASRVQDKVTTGMMTELDENPIGVQVERGTPAPATVDRWTVPLHISFPIENVALIPEGDEYVGRVLLFVAARDTEGRQSDIQRQEHEVRIPAADYEQAQEQRFGIDVSLLMEPGSYRVAVGLMDQVTRHAAYQTVRFALNEPEP
jgi:VWFA-related protein